MSPGAGNQPRRPRRATMIVAALASIALLLVSGLAVWRHQGGSGGDPVSDRSAVIAKVGGAVDAAGIHAADCTERLVDLAGGAIADADLNARLDQLETCGKTARALADAGYTALDAGAGLSASPGRAAYLDAAGSLLSIYEMQGDDFDVIFDMLHLARETGAPIAPLSADITYILGNVAPDLTAGQQELDRARKAYRKRG
ncbi:hypothetical protein [Roseovarius arcticus]|uniref:hypothetical protein n=1 Tax=Roseovarius arcticus TaxID=2547404 RepID=UPI001110D346|nr:hypothetical protein [Roseovarius arcticus]